MQLPDLSPEEWSVFDRLYKEKNVASDNYSYSPTMVKQFAARLSGAALRTRLRAGHERAALTLRTTGDYVPAGSHA